MSRTQQKLQAMSAQELLIQEKKRLIEEKMRLDNAKKSRHEPTNPPNVNNNFEKPQTVGNNMFKNDGSFLEQFQKSQGQSSVTSQNTDIRQSSSYGNEYPSMNSSQQFAPPWFPPNPQSSSVFDQNGPLPFPMPPPPFNPSQLPPPPFPPPFNTQSPFFPPPPSSVTNNSSNFVPPPFLPPSFPLPPPELLSKMFQGPPPPLPIPTPVNTSSTTTVNNNIKNEDLYDPLKVEDEDEEETEQKKKPIQKQTSRTFNIKKEYTIKIEPNQVASTNTNRKWNDDEDDDGVDRKQDSMNKQTINDRKSTILKSR
ncbi:unnamed protein product [Adineta steineri]|uniref:Uncharacterized protein n=2 Tax=Adineta steineri TaxID=433720 RepID=A0A814KMB6_9BILA|nr:unnamed protein product [Adineta steineri]